MVLIKDMEMPNGCASCRIQDYYYGECRITHRKIRHYVDNGDKPQWCPLTDVQQCQEGCDNCKYKELAILVCLEKELSKEK